jgi:dTDP-4-dehydrorhamnose reductase
MNKKFYIAGAGGMLGEAFYDCFSKSNILRCTDIDCNEKWLSKLNFINFENYRKDVVDFNPDYLFHLGAHTDLEYCENNQRDAYETNTLSVINATKISNELNIPLLYISTAGIFDGKKNLYNDLDTPNPLSYYGKTKYDAEKYVIKYSKKYLICRAGWMMGGGIKKDKKFVKKILLQIKEKNKLHIVNDKNGTPTYTVDFAKNVELLIKKEIYGLFNLVCEGQTSRTDVAKAILDYYNLNKKIDIIDVDSSYFSKDYFAIRPPSERLENKKLNSLNLNIMRDWKVALYEYLDIKFNNFIN